MSTRLSLQLLLTVRIILAFSPNWQAITFTSRLRGHPHSTPQQSINQPSSLSLIQPKQPSYDEYHQIKRTDQKQPQRGINKWIAASLATIMMLSLSFTSFPLPCYASDKDIITELGLKPPTETRPQIRLTEDRSGMMPTATKSSAKVPILQGLVYFPERARDKSVDTVFTSTSTPSKEPLDYYSDVLVLTAVSAKDATGPILAGAKFPVSSVRFPFSFSMFEQNLLLKRDGVTEAWKEVQNTSDVIIKAYICPGDAASFPCREEEVKKYAEGVAKLIIDLPGLDEGEVIRAPASLPLQ